ncbi:MAG TPA: hypothetical protein VD710_08895 [Nitrososphaeraceae archaeon]|nr:hypothetical protein [Nitrososphaeraceae archaeon]
MQKHTHNMVNIAIQIRMWITTISFSALFLVIDIQVVEITKFENMQVQVNEQIVTM